MKIVAKPIDVIATFSDNKKPIPYKFKFFRDSGDKIEVYVDKIVTVEESKLAGIDTLIYTCESKVLDESRLYQLKYVIEQYRWELYKKYRLQLLYI